MKNKTTLSHRNIKYVTPKKPPGKTSTSKLESVVKINYNSNEKQEQQKILSKINAEILQSIEEKLNVLTEEEKEFLTLCKFVREDNSENMNNSQNVIYNLDYKNKNQKSGKWLKILQLVTVVTHTTVETILHFLKHY